MLREASSSWIDTLSMPRGWSESRLWEIAFLPVYMRLTLFQETRFMVFFGRGESQSAWKHKMTWTVCVWRSYPDRCWTLWIWGLRYLSKSSRDRRSAIEQISHILQPLPKWSTGLGKLPWRIVISESMKIYRIELNWFEDQNLSFVELLRGDICHIM